VARRRVVSLQQGRRDDVLNEMRRTNEELEVTYEHRSNFKELAERTAASLMTTNIEQGAASTRQR
jgi:truncated hemoglobin YjbI